MGQHHGPSAIVAAFVRLVLPVAFALALCALASAAPAAALPPTIAHIPDHQLVALFLYTDYHYRRWNLALRENDQEALKQYAGRVALVHLKDKLKGAPTALDESVPKQTFVEVGSGAVDFPAVLAAAEAAKVEHYFVEQDHSPDPLASLKQSYQYLTSLT